MQINLFEWIEAQKDVGQIRAAAAGLTEADLRKMSADVDDNACVLLALYVVNVWRGSEIQDLVTKGLFLHLYSLATDRHGRHDLPNALYRKLRVKRTQANRTSHVWINFGRLLLREPKLCCGFTCEEAIKLLASPSVPEMARNEAIELIREGEVINGKRAKTLIAKYLPPPDSEDEGEESPSPVVPRSPKPKAGAHTSWTYPGLVVDIQLKFKLEVDDPQLEEVIGDVKTLLEALQRNPPPMLPVQAILFEAPNHV